MAGVIFGSLVAADTGHITQVCVLPAHKGHGVGYELVRRALHVFAKSLRTCEPDGHRREHSRQSSCISGWDSGLRGDLPPTFGKASDIRTSKLMNRC